MGETFYRSWEMQSKDGSEGMIEMLRGNDIKEKVKTLTFITNGPRERCSLR